MDGAPHSLDLAGRSGGARRDADDICSVEPLGEKLVRALDVVRGRAELAGDLCQTGGVGRDAPADDHHDICLGGKRRTGALMAARGLADGVHHADFLGLGEKDAHDLGEARTGLRGLHDHTELLAARKGLGLLGRTHDDGTGSVGQRGLHLRVALLADDDDLVAFVGQAAGG